MELEIDVKYVALFCIVLFLGAIAYALTNQIIIQNTGQVKTIGVEAYQDFNCTVPLTRIEWGSLQLGQTYLNKAYMLNPGNCNSTLKMLTENWNPSNASNYLTLTWDSENKTLEVQKPLEANFYLTISNETTGITEFSFDIIIIAQN